MQNCSQTWSQADSTERKIHECTNQVRGGGGYTSGTKNIG